jgi:alkylated DNA repair dioxygenase AlkB
LLIGWYPSTVRLEDGSVLIMGGMVAGGFNNAEVRRLDRSDPESGH